MKHRHNDTRDKQEHASSATRRQGFQRLSREPHRRQRFAAPTIVSPMPTRNKVSPPPNRQGHGCFETTKQQGSSTQDYATNSIKASRASMHPFVDENTRHVLSTIFSLMLR
jgi:hypothetical protein